MSTKEKKTKKPHNVKSSVVPPKKWKTKKKDKKGTGKLRKTASNASLKKHGSTHKIKKPEDITSDGCPLLLTASDTCANIYAEQLSAPNNLSAKTSTPHKSIEAALTPVAFSPPPATQATQAMDAPATTKTAVKPTKWKAEDVAVAYIQKLDPGVIRAEYIEACAATKVNIDKDCQLWKKNLQMNQADNYPILDSTIVKNPAQPDSYVNMSSVIVPHCRYPILMAQMPKRGFEEEFWRAAFNESVVIMYVLMGTEDEKNDFFPTTMGAYVYYGAMFVNIRKVEKMDEERTRYTIEVLPNGFSNSVMMNVYVHTGWEASGVPVRYANTTRSVVDVMNFVKTSSGTEKMLVVSKNGCGRAGFFLSLGAAFCCLNDNSEPRIGEIVKAIRSQRPNAVDSIKQYASIYLCFVYYIKKKITIPEGMQQKFDDLKKGIEAIIREDLSIMY